MSDPPSHGNGGEQPGASPLLEARGLVKRFGENVALAGVDFRAFAGEIHGLLGENGAGKSTLMHVATGLYSPDAGEIVFAGRSVRWRTPEQARSHGIAMVHQHFMLVPTLSVAENLALAGGALGWLRRRHLVRTVRALAKRYRLDVGDPARRVEDLSVGDRQRVEILKALVLSEGRGSTASGGIQPEGERRFLVLDEPTAVLTPAEIESLFSMLRELAAAGAAIVIVTHKLAEVLAIADRVTVLRSGRVIASGRARDYDERRLSELMVGAAASAGVASQERVTSPEVGISGKPILEVEGLSAHDRRGALVLDRISFTVASGEILAIAGVEGNGQTELVQALAGVAGATLRGVVGSVRIDGREIRSARDARGAALAVVPPDRTHEGIVGELPAWENLLLALDRLRASSRYGFLRRDHALEAARALLVDFDVRPRAPTLPAGSFSGGNQQRLVLARELGRERIRAAVAANPTRGLDLAATRAVHERLRRLAAEGAAVVVLSTDLDEIERLGTRVGALFRGRLRVVPGANASRAEIGRLMTGAVEAA